MADVFSEEKIQELARTHGFEKRSSRKISAYELIGLLLEHSFGDKSATLNQLCQRHEDQTGKQISKQALDERFNSRLIALIRAILEEVLSHSAVEEFDIGTEQPIEHIRIKDSTSFQLPESLSDAYPGSGGSASKSGVKIHFEYDYLSGRVYQLEVCAGKNSDLSNTRTTAKDLSAGDLTLTDLGYVETAALPVIESQGAYYLFRLQSQVYVYRKKGSGYKRLDFRAIERYMRLNGLSHWELTVYVGEQEHHETRLIIELVPDSLKRTRIEAAKKKSSSRGRTPQDSVLSRMGLNLFITNLSPEQLHIEQARKLYRLRWQVELIFKLWKSLGNIDKVHKMKVERFESHLYVRLLWFFMHWKILWDINMRLFLDREPRMLSFYKAYQGLIQSDYNSCHAIFKNIISFDSFLENLHRKVKRYFLLEPKKGSLSSLDILLQYQLGLKLSIEETAKMK